MYHSLSPQKWHVRGHNLDTEEANPKQSPRSRNELQFNSSLSRHSTSNSVDGVSSKKVSGVAILASDVEFSIDIIVDSERSSKVVESLLL
uniref:Uncharacterized protein n=1 Tax=Romanomermis culicivorax TaxID=13658 RepID=A0A915KJ69_ROMCU